jgi:hypothetical protein
MQEKMNNIIVVDKPKRIKLTTSMRRQLKKEFGEIGYQRFLFANRIGLYGVLDNAIDFDWFRQYLTAKV